MNFLVPFTGRGVVRDYDDLLSRFFDAPRFSARDMKCDIKRDENGYVLNMDLPGVKKEDVNVKLENGYLTISVVEQKKDEEGGYILRERCYSNCQRSFRVGNNVSKDQVKASFEDGVLTLAIEKKDEEPQSNKVEIN